MANEVSPLPQYYGQQLPDGTVIESPTPARHARGSSDSRSELLRLPHQAHVESTFDPVSPIMSTNAVAAGPSQRMSNRHLRGQADTGDVDMPPNQRHRTRHSNQELRGYSHRGAYVEDYPSDEDDYEPQQYRRRPSRARRPPPSAYQNDPFTMTRYGSKAGRNSYDVRSSYHPEKQSYHMHYGSDDDYAPPRRPGLNVTGGGRGGPPERPPTKEVMRLPWAIWMGSNAKNHFVAFVGEFVGTTMFLFFAFSGTQVANIGSNAGSGNNTTTGEATGFSPNVLLYIALVFSFSLMVNVWVFFRISGGLFNPAVTFAMLLCRALSPIRGAMLLAAQISGAIFSSYLVKVLFPTELNVRTTLSTGTSVAQGVFIEAVLTAELVFTIFMLAKEKHKATFIAPVGIGLALFIAELVGVYYTGGSLNPARSFGPCVVTGVFDKEHWIYWVGPGIGAILAVVFYQFIKILEYEVANPGQDDDKEEHEEKENSPKNSPNPNAHV